MEKIKNSKKKRLIAGAILILLIVSMVIFFILKQKPQGNINEDKTYCTPKSRLSAVCTQIYEPVCGYPQGKTYSNSCTACIDKNIEYYLSGECKN